MLTFEPISPVLGAAVHGANLTQPLSAPDFAAVLESLGRYGVLCFKQQSISPQNLRDFSARFGGLQTGLSGMHEPGFPDISVLSNVVENGKLIGLPDAGQDWHTDMSYNNTIKINELNDFDSERMLNVLFEHQLQPKYQYRHQWTVGDVLVWDHIGTLHNALPDYAPHEQRLMKRCQVMADKIFDPAFVRANLALH